MANEFISREIQSASSKLALSRRHLLRTAVTIGAGLGLPAGLAGCGHHGYGHHRDRVLLDATLVASRGEGAEAANFFYNCKTPGPTLRMRRGKKGGQLKIKLVNDLPASGDAEADACPADHNQSHGSNITNLHTHGLHVSPTTDRSTMFDADNIFIKLLPRDDDPEPSCDDGDFRHHVNQHVFDIPADHPPGTHWYHAHKHGSTAEQVAGGLAGALIIEDEEWDGMPSYIKDAPEDVLMIQRLPSQPLSVVRVEEFGGGDPMPEIKMRPGEVRRWRFINSAPFVNTFVSLGGDTSELEIYQIAFDGLTLERRVAFQPNVGGAEPFDDPFALAPGNRMDLIVRVPPDAVAQTLVINAAPFANAPALEGIQALPSVAVAMTVVIEGDPIDAPWSEDDSLPGSGFDPIADGEIVDTRSVQFGPGSTIDGIAFDGVVPANRKMVLGTAEEWTLTNVTFETHPFHIHVNPFFVTHIAGEELASDDPRRRWQDTLAIPPDQGASAPPDHNSVKFRTRFADFTGKFVIHCHILFHEDAGMMQAVEVIEPTA